MTELLQRILPTVQKPARYTGGEFNEIKKNKEDVRVRVAFCFPDTYEIGMSNLGMRILYGVMNQMDGVWCERVFAPWGDMESAMRANNLPLWALESQDAVKDFDMIAFTIGYEMAYSNILNMLNLAGIPLHSRDRHDLKNIVFAGGVCAYNPEPLADFIDFFSLGEGEEITPEILALAGGTGTSLGSGGMATKLKAAQMSMAAGIDMIITNGENPEKLYALLDGQEIGTRFVGRSETQ